MRSIRKDVASRVAKMEIEEERRAAIAKKEQNAQYRNTWYLQDKMDGVNLHHKTAKEELENRRDQKNTTEMCEFLRQQAAPELEIIFDGNSMDFHYFKVVFKEVVDNKLTDSRGRLTRLIKFTKEEAKEIAKKCIQLPSEVGFKTAKLLLTEIFGDPHIITASFHDKAVATNQGW